MDLKTTLQNDMKAAMKAGEATKLGVLRMLIAEIKKREIDKRSAEDRATHLDEGEILKTVQTLIKQRNDSVDAFVKGGREDLAEKERQEIAVLKAYLPQQISETEVEALVVAAIGEAGATGPGDIGKVMKAALAKSGGRADGKLINEIARRKLTKSEELAPLKASFFAGDSKDVAPRLLGKGLAVRHGGEWLLSVIVETEAYHEEDPASHSYAGLTGRTWPMFEAGGTCYVYLSYGINYCMNVVTGRKGRGEAVLLRAAVPLLGTERMRRNRGAAVLKNEMNLMNGPGKLTQAMGIGPQHNGLTFFRDDLKLVDVHVRLTHNDLASSPRIGITKARLEPLRFFVRESKYVSKAR